MHVVVACFVMLFEIEYNKEKSIEVYKNLCPMVALRPTLEDNFHDKRLSVRPCAFTP